MLARLFQRTASIKFCLQKNVALIFLNELFVSIWEAIGHHYINRIRTIHFYVNRSHCHWRQEYPCRGHISSKHMFFFLGNTNHSFLCNGLFLFLLILLWYFGPREYACRPCHWAHNSFMELFLCQQALVLILWRKSVSFYKLDNQYGRISLYPPFFSTWFYWESSLFVSICFKITWATSEELRFCSRHGTLSIKMVPVVQPPTVHRKSSLGLI